MIPKRIGHYDVGDVLGDGAASIVYRGEHRATGRVVAIKTIRPALADDASVRARFRCESRVLGQVRNAHLVDALDAGTLDDGAPYLVLEHLEGATVAVQVAHGPLPIAASIAIAEATLRALDALHRSSVVHRDVKPSNVVLHHDEAGAIVPKLIDLGVCLDGRQEAAPRQTQLGAWIGTPCYMAPEQLAGRGVDPRTDVYGVGALLHECLTGVPPHDGETANEVATRALSEPVLPTRVLRPDCPAALERVVSRALAKSPAARYATAAEMLEALETVRSTLDLPSGAAALAELVDAHMLPIPLRHRAHASSVTLSERLGLRALRKRVGTLGAVLAFVATLASLGLVRHDASNDAPPPLRPVVPLLVGAVEVAPPPPAAPAECTVHSASAHRCGTSAQAGGENQSDCEPAHPLH